MHNVFHVADTFEIRSRKLFCIAGEVEAGTIKAGMCVLVPFNSLFSMSARIDCVEQAQTDTGTRVVLGIRIEDERDWQIWSALQIGNEKLELTEPNPPVRE
jgi:hypothetical protein